jgi:recombinational DNA repair ATPase RecF
VTIKKITIDNVKGIAHQEFELDIIPNKPSLLVAPNGFGKSSFASAFSSLNAARLKLSSEFLHCGSDANKPRLTVTVEADGVTELLEADDASNTISRRFDIHVLSSRLKAKATKRNMGRFTAVSAALEIDSLVLIERVPPREGFGYSLADCRREFGKNGKILKSINAILNDSRSAERLLGLELEIRKLGGDRIQRSLTEIVARTNAQVGTAEQVSQWAELNIETDLESIGPLALVAEALNSFSGDLPTRLDKLLGAYQIYQLHAKDRCKYIAACKYGCYLSEKGSYEAIIKTFDTTWKNVKPKEVKGKLVVDFPLAAEISNGQRDSLSFAAWLQRVSSSQTERDCIIIIDEVFDYLDDANLVAVQYYVSNLIQAKKAASGRVYPLILTHLNPLYFKNFTFKDQKVYFLKKYKPTINQHLKKLIVKRGETSISAGVDRYYFHYDPTQINLRSEFAYLGIKETWGDSAVFHAHLVSEWKKYLANQDDYDPFAVCCYVRVKIEEKVYNNITDDAVKASFLGTNGTTKKLEHAESSGVVVKDAMYLLGLIYNEGMHIRDHVDNGSPIVAKLENLTIRRMLVECVDG